MLRRVKSAGLLTVRSTATTTIHTVLPASPIQQLQQSQNRSLASAVLLSSQRNWKGETVAGLKMELKKRGLSQQGNKATLIARLSSAEISSHLPAMPSPTSNTRSNSPSPTIIHGHSRSLSTTAAKFAKSTNPPSKSLPKEDTGSDTPPSVTSDVSVTTSGPDVSTKSTEAPRRDKITPEQVTSAPGLPVTEVTSSESVEKMDVKLPKARTDGEGEIEQIIPSTPDNFLSNTTNPAPSSEKTESDQPKVMTVASASTHPAGGPVHGDHSSSDAHSHELKLEEAASEALKAAEGSIPSLTDAVRGILTAPIRAWQATGLELPAIGAPKPSDGGGEEFKPIERGLNDEERRGAYILAGIAGLALLLGGPKSEKKKKDHDGGKGKGGEGKQGRDGKEGKGVMGDKEWEKASGAGIVGHGARKD